MLAFLRRPRPTKIRLRRRSRLPRQPFSYPGAGVRRALPEKRAGRWFLLEPIPSGPPSESVRAIGSKAADVIEMRLSQQPHPCFSSAGSSKDSIALRFR
jgi:hypothetical protein